VVVGCKLSLYALKFIGVSNCNRVPGNTEAYSSLYLTEAKYSISRLSVVEKENVCELILIISSNVKKENQYEDENEI
jgi:hypothetical protein